jgi:hypothetical protein
MKVDRREGWRGAEGIESRTGEAVVRRTDERSGLGRLSPKREKEQSAFIRFFLPRGLIERTVTAKVLSS